MGKFSQIIFRSTSENLEEMHQNYFLFGIFSSLRATISEIKYFKVLEKCTKNLIGHSRLAFNNHESNIDC